MRTHHTQHSLDAFPVYSAAFLDDHKLVLGGGGGSSRSGIKNKLRLYEVPDDEKLTLLSEFELGKDEDAPMSMVADEQRKRIICGVNSAVEQLDKGINKNCRMFSVNKDGFELLDTASTLDITSKNMEDCQKVTAFSPGRTLLAAAGTRDLSILSYPSLTPVAQPLHTEHDIYDVAFSNTSILVATTGKLLVYKYPLIESLEVSPGTKTRNKAKEQKQKEDALTQSQLATELQLLNTIDPPSFQSSSKSAFRAARFHPTDDSIVYTALNSSPSTRTRGSRVPAKQGYICRWDAETWKLSNSRKIGERGITCLDVSSDGKFIAYGAANYSVGILDSTTLAPLLSVLKAHDFPSTVLKFNPSSNLLVSGSADNTVRVITVPEKLAGTTWTTGSVILIAIFVLLLAVLVQYLFVSSRLGL
ncbi:WD40 domain containing protein [Pyrrhoderma noxium]|uniref:WD40 domain containing protein n=1 Tax=Pyrrhoderma noxium TaxID=2282107 RepID=A0A286UMW5_9AGAM|nr:WD40 domain containing protein [Pyrrhoderma noxium]